MTKEDFLDEIQRRYGPIDLNQPKTFSMRTFAEMLAMAGVLDVDSQPRPIGIDSYITKAGKS